MKMPRVWQMVSKNIAFATSGHDFQCGENCTYCQTMSYYFCTHNVKKANDKIKWLCAAFMAVYIHLMKKGKKTGISQKINNEN